MSFVSFLTRWLLNKNAGWTKETIQENQIGYAEKENVFITPMRHKENKLVGYEYRDGNKFKHICKTKGYAEDKKKTLCFINFPEKPKFLMICAGLKDSITMRQYLKEHNILDDYQIVTCSNGEGNTLNALLANIELLGKYEKIILCLDRDKAGKSARDKIAENLERPVFELVMPYIKNSENKSFKDFTDWYKLAKATGYAENILDSKLQLCTYSLFNHYIKNPDDLELDEKITKPIASQHQKYTPFIKNSIYPYKNSYFKISVYSNNDDNKPMLSAEKKSNFRIKVKRKVINHRIKFDHQSEYRLKIETYLKDSRTKPVILTQKEFLDSKNIHEVLKENGIHLSSLNEIELKNVILNELNDNPIELHTFENPGLASLEDKEYWIYKNAGYDFETKEIIEGKKDTESDKIHIEIQGNKEICLDVLNGMFAPTIYLPKSSSTSDFLKEVNSAYLHSIYEKNKTNETTISNIIASALVVNTMESYNYTIEPFILLGAAIMSPFVGLIVNKMKGFPISYAFGEAQSGKSNLLELISSIYGFDEKFLSSGNDTALNLLHNMEYYSSIPLLFSEVEGSIRKKFEETVKAVYDRSSRKIQSGYGKSQDVKAVNASLFFASNTIAHRNNQTSTRLLYTEFKKDNFNYKITKEFNNIRPYASLILKEILSINPIAVMGYIQGALKDLEMMQTNIDSRSLNNIAIARAGMRLLFNAAGNDFIFSLDGYKGLEENFIDYVGSYSESIAVKDIFDTFIEIFLELVKENKALEHIDFKFMDNNKSLAINLKGIYPNFSKYFKQISDSNTAIPNEKEIKNAVKAKGHDSDRNVKYGKFQGKSLSIDLEANESLSHIQPVIIDALSRITGVSEDARVLF